MDTSVSWIARLTGSPNTADWHRLSHDYRPLIRSWIDRAGVSATDSDDLVQDVLVVVVKRIHEFEHRHPGAFRAWLRAILANQLRKYFREHSRVPLLFAVEDLADPSTDEAKTFDREHDEFLALQVMTQIEHEFEPKTWSAFRMQVVEHMSPASTAQAAGMTINAVIKAKSRVLQRLRSRLGDLVAEQSRSDDSLRRN